jgi:hypothetical protein
MRGRDFNCSGNKCFTRPNAGVTQARKMRKSQFEGLMSTVKHRIRLGVGLACPSATASILNGKGFVHVHDQQMRCVRKPNGRSGQTIGRLGPKALRRWVGRVRRRIETASSMLTTVFHIELPAARSLAGVICRISTRLLAYNLCFITRRLLVQLVTKQTPN